MKNTRTKQISEADLFDYYNKQLSPEKLIEVSEWIDASEINQKQARQVETLLIYQRTYDNLQRKNQKQAFNQVNQRINRRRAVKISMKLTGVAATLLFLTIFGWLVTEKVKMSEFEQSIIEVKMSQGMIGSVVLPDGSEVWLNSGTSLSYPARFTDKDRKVQLNGEAYFKIKRNDGKKFLVVIPGVNDYTVEVLGTEFNVDAYTQNDFISTTLVSGKVKLSYQNSESELISDLMEPDEKIVYNPENRMAEKLKINSEIDAAWHTNSLILQNTPMKEVLWILSKRFGVEFEVKNKKLYDSEFTGSFTDIPLERILQYLTISSGIRHQIQNSDIAASSVNEKRKIILY